MKKVMLVGVKASAQVRLIGGGLSFALMLMAGLTAPSTAQERLERDIGIVRACGADVWHLCSSEPPDIGRVKACVQDKMASFQKVASIRSLRRCQAHHSRSAKIRPTPFVLRHAAMCTTVSPTVSAT